MEVTRFGAIIIGRLAQALRKRGWAEHVGSCAVLYADHLACLGFSTVGAIRRGARGVDGHLALSDTRVPRRSAMTAVTHIVATARLTERSEWLAGIAFAKLRIGATTSTRSNLRGYLGAPDVVAIHARSLGDDSRAHGGDVRAGARFCAADLRPADPARLTVFRGGTSGG